MRRSGIAVAALAAMLATGCRPGGDSQRAPGESDAPPATRAPTAPTAAEGEAAPDVLPRFRLSVVGINDLHGHVERVPVYAGYLANLRAAGFKTVVVDGGDMFQGTLVSNLGEGDAVIAAYNAMGVDAAAIGNHEFDFGPVGPDATVQKDGDDPQGALKARAVQAAFPLLATNVVDDKTGKSIAWEGVRRSVVVTRGMIKVGILGATTMGTPNSTIAPNFAGLRMSPLAEALESEARALREQGVHVVIASVHAGASCTDFDGPDDLASCDLDDELTAAVRSLPPGLIDVVVAAHSHRAMAHRVNGTAIIQQYSYGRAIGRVDLYLQQRTLKVADVVIHPPRDLCKSRRGPCEPGEYEGAPVVADAAIAKLLEPFIERARKLEAQPLGVELAGKIKRSYAEESALGNLFTDALLAQTPGADVSLTNGGGLRADLPAGPLVYGELYEAMPFDNRVTTLPMRVADLERAFARNLSRSGGILSVSGVRVVATCREGQLDVELFREAEPGAAGAETAAPATGKATKRRKKGRKRRGDPREPGPTPLADDTMLTVVTNDYVALRGDKVLGVVERTSDLLTMSDAIVRDEIAAYLEAKGSSTAAVVIPGAAAPSTLSSDELLEPRRLVYPGKRPVRCDG